MPSLGRRGRNEFTNAGGIKLWQSEPPHGAKDLGTMKLEIELPWFLRWAQASWDLCKGLVGMSASEATCGGKQSHWETGLMTEEGATHQQMQAASGSQESRGESLTGARGRDTIVLTQWLWDLHNRKVTHAGDFKPWATAAGVSHYRSAGPGWVLPPSPSLYSDSSIQLSQMEPLPQRASVHALIYVCSQFSKLYAIPTVPGLGFAPQETYLGSTTIPDLLEV